MDRKRILVIDDSKDIHQDFIQLLCPEAVDGEEELNQLEAALFGPPASSTSRGPVFELDSAFQGQEGLAKVSQALAAGRPYALAFLDYRMPPGWNGFETLKHLRKVAPSLPVVLCSAYSDYSWEEIREEFKGDLRLAELRKPFDRAELYELALSLTGSPRSP